MNQNELEKVIRTIVTERLAMSPQTDSGTNEDSNDDNECCIFADVDAAIGAAKQAYLRYRQAPLKSRSAIIDKLRSDLAADIAEMSRQSVAETGMGNVNDKIQKNMAALNNTPGVEDLRTTALTGDDGMVLFEYSPFGVIGSITPSTNPTETIINNAISMLAGGNAIYFSCHPSAKTVSEWLVRKIENLIFQVTGIHNLVVTIAEPSFEATQAMMAHKDINLLAVTGGPGIVSMAMKSGKKVIGAGAGNPPCLVDETAEIVKAAQDIVLGASLDNNLPCIAEKSVIVIDSVADCLIQQMQEFGALLITRAQDIEALTRTCLPDGAANKKLVGKDPLTILQQAGIDYGGQPPKLVIMEVAQDHPFVRIEQLMPVLPIVRVHDFEQGLALALEVEHGLHHTAIMHSQNVSRLNKAAQLMQTSIFVKNGPSYAGIGVGAEGSTTFTIATPTGEGTTTAKTFCRTRRCTLTNGFSIR